MIVLESAEDYRRFRLDRQALADILVIGPRGVQVMHDRAVQDRGQRPRDSDQHRRRRLTLAVPRARPRITPEEMIALQQLSPSASRSSAQTRPPTPEMSISLRDDEDCCDDDDDASAAPGPWHPRGPSPLAGRMAHVASQIHAGQIERALVSALRWRTAQPNDPLALIALGQALEASGNQALAARAYGSIIDLFPSRAEMRRLAAGRLEGLGKHGQELAIDSYREAVALRPDHPSGHHLLVAALWRSGQQDAALAAAEQAISDLQRLDPQNLPVRDPQGGPVRRLRGRPGLAVLRRDLAQIGAAIVAREPTRRSEITARLLGHRVGLADRASLRIVLTWESDANDVDLLVRDGAARLVGGKHDEIGSHWVSITDVWGGFGPEQVELTGSSLAFPYVLYVHYARRGPTGHPIGKVHLIGHDGHGCLRFEDRPFVLMTPSAHAPLGLLRPDAVCRPDQATR
jgi:tetratricopeptide (TPR) repeat protein